MIRAVSDRLLLPPSATPIVVYDDLRIDDHGRPAAWLYHIECCACGQVLQLQPVEEPPA